MIILNKNLIFALCLILVISIYGCKGKKDLTKTLEEIRTGTEGIVINFLPNTLPEKIHVEHGIDNPPFDVILELKNKGAYPQPDDVDPRAEFGSIGMLYLSGFDNKIIEFETTTIDLSDKALEGKSTINPNGGFDVASFKGRVIAENLNVEKYEPILLATICYNYHTIAGPPVCIDPNPYSTIKEKKVCEVKDITLSNQGAPIAVTKIKEEAYATKTQFRITIKNIGGGDSIRVKQSSEFFEKCDPFGSKKVERDDIDKVYLQEVKISDNFLQCGPYTEDHVKGIQGYVRLVNGEGSVICEFQKSDYGKAATAYTTPIKIKLSYGYRTVAERKMRIIKETTAAISDTPPYTELP